MNASTPTVKVPGDSEDGIMARSGDLAGVSPNYAVWRFGFLPDSSSAKAHDVAIRQTGDGRVGFLWAFTWRGTGVVIRTFTGYANELPEDFRAVINWLPGASEPQAA